MAGPANTHKVKLVQETIDAKYVKGNPKNLIEDMAYDSDPLDKQLKKRKIKRIAPHQSNRKKNGWKNIT
jgi:hypothetical protein